MNIEKEKKAIDILQKFEPQKEPYFLCYSGGKDSDAIKILAHLSGVKFDAVNNHTTLDAPETVNYIRSQKDVQIQYPDKSMWRLIIEKGFPPTRLLRYCCAELKEGKGDGRLRVTGVRWEESSNRKNNNGFVTIKDSSKKFRKAIEDNDISYEDTKKGGIVMNDDNSENRRFVEHCYRTSTTLVNPIIDWSEQDVWEFLHHYGCESNPLYQCGYKRIGCIGCPMATKKYRYEEFERYPKYKKLYMLAFQKMQDKRIADCKNPLGDKFGKVLTGKEIFDWWMGKDLQQYSFFDSDEAMEIAEEYGLEENFK